MAEDRELAVFCDSSFQDKNISSVSCKMDNLCILALFLTSPLSLQVGMSIGGDTCTCSHVLSSSLFFFTYIDLILCPLQVSCNWRSSEMYQLIYHVCQPLQEVIMFVCDQCNSTATIALEQTLK